MSCLQETNRSPCAIKIIVKMQLVYLHQHLLMLLFPISNIKVNVRIIWNYIVDKVKKEVVGKKAAVKQEECRETLPTQDLCVLTTPSFFSFSLWYFKPSTHKHINKITNLNWNPALVVLNLRPRNFGLRKWVSQLCVFFAWFFDGMNENYNFQ